jgi:hypothetical protein
MILSCGSSFSEKLLRDTPTRWAVRWQTEDGCSQQNCHGWRLAPLALSRLLLRIRPAQLLLGFAIAGERFWRQQ